METSPANQWTDFHMIETSVMKELTLILERLYSFNRMVHIPLKLLL